jgi:hypothetical protein
MFGAEDCDREIAINALYDQMLWVIGVILALGGLGIFLAWEERTNRERRRSHVGRDNSSAGSGAEAEDIAQHGNVWAHKPSQEERPAQD